MSSSPIEPALAPEFAHLAEFDIGIGAADFDLDGIRVALAALDTPSDVEGVLTDTRTIGPDPGVKVEIYQPAVSGDAGRSRPALVWFHGGGYVFGTPGMDRARLQGWAERLGCLVVSVDYRLAPEHPFPAAHDDGVHVLERVVSNAHEPGVDVARIVVGGASAGGGLAAGVALAARDRGLPLLGQLLWYPMIDDRQVTPSSRWQAPMWPPAANTFGWRSYLGNAHGGDVSPYAAPARAEDLAGSAPALIIVGGADGFVDEDLDYARRLTHAGVLTDTILLAGAPHGFDLVAPESPVSSNAAVAAEAWLAKRYASG